MWEIFIPEKIFDKICINNIQENLLDLLETHFEISKISDFKSTYCSWKYFKIKNINQDILSLLNWEFWETYFVDYDFLKHDYDVSWTKILKPENITKNILQIWEQFNQITQDLSSNKLLTNSKKQDIHLKIEKIFFTISWILFLLYNLREKTRANYKELWEYNGKIEYEGQAALITESVKTKEIELSAQIDKFEAKSEIFFQTIQKIFL
jgi:hypothetical protein